MLKLLILTLSFILGTDAAHASFNPNMLRAKTGSAVVQNQSAAVDINHASAKELMSLKGVGEKRAEAIIAYRQQHGLFKSVNELSAVKGFSEKKLASLLKNNEGRMVAKAAA